MIMHLRLYFNSKQQKVAIMRSKRFRSKTECFVRNDVFALVVLERQPHTKVRISSKPDPTKRITLFSYVSFILTYRFSSMVQWMDAVDSSIKNLLKELATAEEFEREKVVFQVHL